MPEKMRTAGTVSGRTKRKAGAPLRQALEHLGGDGDRGRRSGLPLSSRPGGRLAGPREARDETPYARTRHVSITLRAHFLRACPPRVGAAGALLVQRLADDRALG